MLGIHTGVNRDIQDDIQQGDIQNDGDLSIVTRVSFVLVVAVAGISIVALLDAFLPANLYIYSVLDNLHASVVGLVLSIVAAAGIAEAIIGMRNIAAGNAAGTSVMAPVPSMNMRLDAERLQTMLHVLRYPVRIDGEFGPDTSRTISDFQRDAGLEVDGNVGPLTLEALQKRIEISGRSDWVIQILQENQPVRQEVAPVLSLVGAPQAI